MGSYAYRKVDIEGVGCFTVSKPVWDLLQDIDTIRDAVTAELTAARAELTAIREAMGAYPDSDLVSLATTMRVRLAALEASDN